MEDFEKLFYIYQHFQDSEKIHQIGTDSDVLTTQEDSLYPYINNDIEYGLLEDIVESYHLDSQIKDDFQCVSGLLYTNQPIDKRRLPQYMHTQLPTHSTTH